MRQQLWILNSSLLGVLGLTLIISMILSISAPPEKKRRARPEAAPQQQRPAVVLDAIFQNDVFGLYVPPRMTPTRQTLTTPMPMPQMPPPIPVPEIKKPELLPALTLTLNGIVMSSSEEMSIAMIADETGKEGIFHIGDQIKDALILRISRNRVVLLRTNGQIETFFLRKDDALDENVKPKSWEEIVKRQDDGTYLIDREGFGKAFRSPGEFIETFLLMPVMQNNLVRGLRIGKSADIAQQFGIQKDDLIVGLNGFPTSDGKNRIKILDSLTTTATDNFLMQIDRAGSPLVLSYKFGILEKTGKYAFLQRPPGSRPISAGQTLVPTSTLQGSPTIGKQTSAQEREAVRKNFEQQNNPNYLDSILEIRKRLLDNMRSRPYAMYNVNNPRVP